MFVYNELHVADRKLTYISNIYVKNILISCMIYETLCLNYIYNKLNIGFRQTFLKL